MNLLTIEEEQELARKVQEEGCMDSRNELVERNLLLVKHIASQFNQDWCGTELISAGNTGLIEAASKYKPNSGAKFSSYASHWIKLRIRKELCLFTTPMRVPANRAYAQYLFRNERSRRKAAGESLSYEDIGAALGESKRVSRDLASETFRTFAPVGQERGEYDIGGEDAAVHVIEEAEHMSWLMEKAKGSLSDKQYDILSRLFALEGCERETLREIGAEYERSHEAIRIFKEKALLDLKRLVNAQEGERVIKRKRGMQGKYIYPAYKFNALMKDINYTPSLEALKEFLDEKEYVCICRKHGLDGHSKMLSAEVYASLEVEPVYYFNLKKKVLSFLKESNES